MTQARSGTATRRARRLVVGATAALVLAALRLGAEQPPATERGREAFVASCGFCHGASARGAASGSDLTRSALVADDEGGNTIGAFLKVGRPENGMPRFDLGDQTVAEIAAFLRSQIDAAANRRDYKILDIVTGDATAGEAYFTGAGKCAVCHSPARDLAGIGSKYDAVTLQSRMVMPRGGRVGGPPVPPDRDPNAVRVTVTLPSGQSFTGVMLRLTDFDVMLREDSGQTRSWFRRGDTPTVVLTDPIRAHVDMLTRWTDTDMRNVTAYLVTLK